TRGAQYAEGTRPGARRAPCSQTDQRDAHGTPHNSWRRLSIENCTADFPVSSAARSSLGTEKVLQTMTRISDAVILMAGEGSRLRGSDKTVLKPFVPVLGRPLISYTLDAL